MGFPTEGTPAAQPWVEPGHPVAAAWAEPGRAPAGSGWPANELEQVLTAAIGDPGATPRVVEVLARSHVWIPLPAGGDPQGQALDLPAIELAGAPYVPVFSSEEQFLRHAGGLAFAVAPAWEFARGLPLGVGIAVNPEAPVGIPVPPEGVGELRRGPRADRWGSGGDGYPGGSEGARVALRTLEPHEEPVAFLTAVQAELAQLPGVLTARRALASVEGEPPVLFVGVQLDPGRPADPAEANAALGRALGVAPLPWQVHIVLLDLVADPVVDWLSHRVQPFYARL